MFSQCLWCILHCTTADLCTAKPLPFTPRLGFDSIWMCFWANKEHKNWINHYVLYGIYYITIICIANAFCTSYAHLIHSSFASQSSPCSNIILAKHLCITHVKSNHWRAKAGFNSQFHQFFLTNIKKFTQNDKKNKFKTLVLLN